jgi:hypothetical protein
MSSSSGSALVIRVRSESGTKRFEVQRDATVGELKAQIASVLGGFADEQQLSQDAMHTRTLSVDAQALASVGVQHGDLLYLKSKASSAPKPLSSATASTASVASSSVVVVVCFVCFVCHWQQQARARG